MVRLTDDLPVVKSIGHVGAQRFSANELSWFHGRSSVGAGFLLTLGFSHLAPFSSSVGSDPMDVAQRREVVGWRGCGVERSSEAGNSTNPRNHGLYQAAYQECHVKIDFE